MRRVTLSKEKFDFVCDARPEAKLHSGLEGCIKTDAAAGNQGIFNAQCMQLNVELCFKATGTGR